MNPYANKTALVTGAAAGIGRGLCLALCEQGAHVYAADIQADKLEQLAANANGPGSISALILDVSRKENFDSAFQSILASHEKLDFVFNNAGIVIGGDFNETSLADIEKITAINYWGVIYGTKLAYEIMVKQRSGHIINVASPAGVMPVPMSTAYATTKHAVIGLVKSLRTEAALYGINVCAVLPGMVKSELWDKAINTGDYDYKAEMESTNIGQITAAEAATYILKGVNNNDQYIVFPFANKLIVKLFQLFPTLLTPVVTAPLLKPLKKTLGIK